jgi:hypothetical protein
MREFANLLSFWSELFLSPLLSNLPPKRKKKKEKRLKGNEENCGMVGFQRREG